jgi:transcriptional regulator with XRE-family HTH domain/KaiC/GvpD/RAD55 family RecA-like ATPase
MSPVSSGVPHLDRFLGGFQPGDNVVWVGEAGSFIPAFVGAFVQATREDTKKTVVYVNCNYAPQSLSRRFAEKDPRTLFVQVDAFTHGKGKGDPVFLEHYKNLKDPEGFRSVCLERPYDAEAFSRELSVIEEECGDGVRYVFDSLTGLSELWGGERPVQEFFAHHCPKLYELQTVAYWVLEREAHPRAFVANLSHITQVVIQLRNKGEGVCEMEFHKAEDRPSRVLYEAVRFRVSRDRIEFADPAPSRDLHLGKRIKALRTGWDLSQAELARRLNITPSALCQIENDQVQPSLGVLLNLSQLLRCSLDVLIYGDSEERSRARGWLVHKKKDQAAGKGAVRSAVEIRPLLPEPGSEDRISPYLLRLDPEAEGERGFFDHKGPEFGWVFKGMVKVAIDGEEVVLRAGDGIYLKGQTVRRWKTEGKSRCELIWVLAS